MTKMKVDWEKIYQGTQTWSITPSLYVKYFVRYLRKKDVVLDLGCGTGRDCIPLAKAGFRPIGIDISKKAIETAIINSRRAGVKIHYDIGEAENLPYSNAFFDAVYSGFTLQSSDLKKASKEVARVLRPGGIAFCPMLLTTVWLANSKKETYYKIPEILNSFKKNFKILKVKEYETLDKLPKLHRHRALLLIMRRR